MLLTMKGGEIDMGLEPNSLLGLLNGIDVRLILVAGVGYLVYKLKK